MKGQYLAVESVLTFGLGIVLAIGVIGAFDVYSSNIYETSEEVQATMIQNQVLEAFNVLNAVEGNAEYEVDLPDSAGNSEYFVEAGDTVSVVVDGESYDKQLAIDSPVSGSGSGSIRIVKSDGNYNIDNR